MRLLGQFQTFYIFFHKKISQVQKSTTRYRENSVFQLVPLNTQTLVYLRV